MNPTKIQTSRFGDIDVGPEHFIAFRDGMIGFPHLKQYVLVESSSMPVLLWLQSTENPAVAFPVIEPWFFKKDYKPVAGEAERVCIQLEPGDKTKMFVVITIPPDMSRMTVNMKAPIFINLDKGTAVQLVLADKNYEVRVPAYEAFSQAISTFSLVQSVDAMNPSAAQQLETEAWNPVNVKGASSERLNSISL